MSDETPVMNPVLAQTEPAAHVMNVEGIPSGLMVLWKNAGITSLERFQAAPNRIKATVRLNSVEAFCDFVNRFANPATSIYLDVYGSARGAERNRPAERLVPPNFCAVIDHPEKDAPSWGGFNASYAPRLSMEWVAWRSLHERGPLDQVALMEFLEDHCNDISTPTPAAVLTAAGEFDAVEKHTYASHRNLNNGNVQITYTKGNDTTNVTFPHELTLTIPLIEGSPTRQVKCRLRYRTGEGSIRFLFQIAEDPDRAERDAYRAEAATVRERCKALKLYEGVAETPARLAHD